MSKTAQSEQHAANCACEDCMRKREANPASASGALLRGKHAVESLVSLHEAVSVDRALREIRCRVIREGMGNKRDRHFYGPEAIRSIADRINEGGVRCFRNHQTEEEARTRSEGDITNMAGYWKDATVETAADGRSEVVATLVLDESEAGTDILAKTEASIAFAHDFPGLREVYAGLSINGDGDVEPKTVKWEGVELEANYVKEVSALPSIDAVTRPAREGQFLRFLESLRSETDPQEVRTMKEKALKESAARLAEAATKLAKDEIKPAEYLALVEAENEKMKAMKKETEGKAGGKESEESEEEAEARKRREAEAAAGEDGHEEPDADDIEKDGEKKAGGKETVMRKSEERIVRHAESDKRIRQLEKELAESKKRERAAAVSLTESKIEKTLEAAGLSDVAGLTAHDLAGLDPSVRKAIVSMGKSLHESGVPFGGVTPRSSGGSNLSGGAEFAKLCEASR